jgi:hypothetical protein
MQKAKAISHRKEPRRAKSKAIVSPAGKIAASSPLTNRARPMRTMANPPTRAAQAVGHALDEKPLEDGDDDQRRRQVSRSFLQEFPDQA